MMLMGGGGSGWGVQDPLVHTISVPNPAIRIILKSNPNSQKGSADNEEKSAFQ